LDTEFKFHLDNYVKNCYDLSENEIEILELELKALYKIKTDEIDKQHQQNIKDILAIREKEEADKITAEKGKQEAVIQAENMKILKLAEAAKKAKESKCIIM
jgi:hypothetical protein